MCGRFTLTRPVKQIAEQFDVPDIHELQPRYNIAPTQKILAIRHDTNTQSRFTSGLRWGLVPSWASDLSIGNRLLNARAETIESKPSFRTAFRRRRCLIPSDGFYEWQAIARKKQPIHFRFRDQRLFAFAGLWEQWTSPEGLIIETCTILTTAANELIAPVHNRMPVIISPEDYSVWLRPASEEKVLHDVMRTWPASDMTAIPASTWVNNARNEGPECLQRV